MGTDIWRNIFGYTLQVLISSNIWNLVEKRVNVACIKELRPLELPGIFYFFSLPLRILPLTGAFGGRLTVVYLLFNYYSRILGSHFISYVF